MASQQISHGVIVICCLWSLYGGGESSQKLEQCFTTQSAPNHIELCHDHLQPGNVGPYTCNSPNYGFILSHLKIGPRSKFQDCGSFHTRDLLDPKCLRNVVKNVDQFDAAVFDLLEKVSGKNRIDNNTVVERFSWSTVSEDGGEETDSSAFVSFQDLCKPVRPSTTGGENNQFVRMCSTEKVAQSSVFLTLQGLDPSHVPDGPSRCWCTITPNDDKVTLKAFDIRLQHNRTCPPGVSLKVHAGNHTIFEEKCDGLSSVYGLETIAMTDQELTLDLQVSPPAMPDVVWLLASSTQEDGSSSLKPLIVTCGVTPLGTHVTGNVDQEEESNTPLIVGVVAGCVVGIGLICAVLVFLISKRRQREPQKIDNDEQENMYQEIEPDYTFKLPHSTSESAKPAPTPPPNHPSAQPKVNPVSKPPRTFSTEQSPEENQEAADDEEYDRLTRSGSNLSKKNGAGVGSRKGSDRVRERYHRLELDNTAEAKPLQPQEN